MLRLILTILLACFASALAACKDSTTPAPGAGASGKMTLAVIPKGTTHEFWKSIHAGANKAARELDVEIIWQGPLKEDDRQQQIGVVEQMRVKGVKGIVLAPLDHIALARPVEEAVAKNIPVVIIDSDLQSKALTSFVATDNYNGGRIAGKHLAELIGKKGKVALLRYHEGSASTMQREQGFLDAIKEFPEISVASSDQRTGATVEKALEKSEQLMALLKREEVQGIFTPCEPVSFAMMKAIESNNLGGKLKHVGFDASPGLVAGLEQSRIEALIVQDPVNMGYLGVKTLVAHLKGQKVEARIDTGVHLITTANMKEPANQELLKPDLDKWLK